MPYLEDILPPRYFNHIAAVAKHTLDGYPMPEAYRYVAEEKMMDHLNELRYQSENLFIPPSSVELLDLIQGLLITKKMVDANDPVLPRIHI